MDTADSLSIVIVDDSTFARKQLTDLLKGSGYNVVGTASNAKEALVVIKEKSPDVALVDIVMPELTGIDLTKIIQEMDLNSTIIMMSSLTHEQIVLEAISSGAVDFLQKPIDPQQLFDSLERIKSNKGKNT